MNEAYAAWIAKNVRGDGQGYCRQIAEEMVTAFPELTVWGKFCPIDGTGHAWCQTPEGEVIDPTAAQFSGEFDYTGGVPLSDFPTGKCCECGELLYGAEGHSSLHRACEAAYAAYLMGSVR